MDKQVQEIILAMLARVESQLDKVRSEDIPGIKERLKGVEVRSAIAGAITGSVGGATITALIMRFMR